MEFLTQIPEVGTTSFVAFLVVGFTEMVKNTVPVPYNSKLAPWAAVFFGGTFNALLSGLSVQNVLVGFAVGVATSGLYRALSK